MNLIEAAENYLEKTREFEKKVKEILGEDWTVLVQSIDRLERIPVDIWSKQANPDFGKNGEVYSLSFILERYHVTTKIKCENWKSEKYTADELTDARRAIKQVLEKDKSFVDQEIERIENGARK